MVFAGKDGFLQKGTQAIQLFQMLQTHMTYLRPHHPLARYIPGTVITSIINQLQCLYLPQTLHVSYLLP